MHDNTEPRNITKRSARSKRCVFPDGTYSRDDSPCFPDDEDSMCCGNGHACMSNGLCRDPGAELRVKYTRGSCTGWGSSSCPTMCVKNTKQSAAVFISQCYESPFYYCCDADYESAKYAGCCGWENAFTFDISSASTVTVIPAGGIPWVPETTTSTSTTSTSSSSTPESTILSDPTTTSSRADSVTSRGGEIGGGSSLTQTPTSNLPSGPTAPSLPEPPQPTTDNNTLTIGLGAGIGGGVASLALILLAIWYVRRRKPGAARSASAAGTLDEMGGGVDSGIYESTPDTWRSQQSQPFLVQDKPAQPPIYSVQDGRGGPGGWEQQLQMFPVDVAHGQASELPGTGQGRRNY